MNLEEKLKWRYACKRFDPNRTVSDEELNKLMDSISLTASSFGLEPYQILVIKDQDIRKQLTEASWNQPQITEASHLLLFCVNPLIGEKEIDLFLNLSAETRGIPLEALADYKAMMIGHISAMSEEQREQWCAKQAYIALGYGLVAAADLGIDACPMEGFDADKYNELLDLSPWKAKVILAIGYRSEEDHYQHLKKVRKSKESLFKFYND